MTRSSVRLGAICLGASLVSGCGSSSLGSPVQSGERVSSAQSAIRTPALIAVTRSGELKYWPFGPHGGGSRDIQVIGRVPGLAGAGSMAANGNVVAIVSGKLPGVFLYDVTMKTKRTLKDPYGTPFDVAIDTSANIFVLNYNASGDNVTMYRAHSSQPLELSCQYIQYGKAIAADNEGDVFVNGSQNDPRRVFTGVVEIPNGPNGPQPGKCARLSLGEIGYPGGLAVDPKTDDLIVLSDPDQCAGGVEGLMTIYPKPYTEVHSRSVNLNGNCVGIIRLDATSSRVFALDVPYPQLRTHERQRPNGEINGLVILQRSYPDGNDMGRYLRENPTGFTTIPNTLPN